MSTMPLREVEWRDTVGRRWIAMLPDDMPDEMAAMGLQYGPVSLAPLDLPLKYEVLLHNELVQRKLLTWDAVKKNPAAVEGAIRSIVRAGAHEIIACFREATGG